MSTETLEPIAPPPQPVPRPGAAADVNVNLRRLLGRLRRGIQRHLVLECLSWMAVTALAWSAASFVLDYLVKMTIPQRGLILALGVAGLSVILYRFLWRPLRRGMSDEDLALVVEKHYPQLEDRVITTIQLATKAPNTGEDGLSPQLLDVVAEQADESIAKVSITEPYNSRRLGKRLLYGGAAVAVFVSAFLAFPEWMNIYVQRVWLLRSVEWPHNTYLEIVGFQNRLMRVARGAEVPIVVRATEKSIRIPQSVWFHMRFAASGRFKEKVDRSEANQFTKKFSNVIESFVFNVTGGDYRTEEYTVEVVDPPVISNLKFTCDYPQYTGLPPRDFSGGEGGLEAVAGTAVTVEAFSSKPLREGKLMLNTRQVAVLEIQGGTQLKGRWQMKSPETDTGLLKFVLTDIEGFSSDAYAYPVTTQPDRPPMVKLQTKGVGDRIVPNARVPLEVDAFDDYGIHQTNLVYQFRDDTREPKTMGLAGAPVGRKKFTFTYPWEVESIGLKPGDVITFYSEALDYVQGKGASGPLALRVVRREELMEDVRRMLKQYSAELERLTKRQRDTTIKTKLTRDELQAGATQDSQRYQEIIADERDLGNALQNLSDQVARLTDERENNRLDNEQEYAHWRNKVVAPLSDVSKQVLGPVVARVSESHAAPQQIAAIDRLNLGIAEQEAIEARLEIIRGDMAAYAEWRDILDAAHHLLDQARTTKEGIDKAYEDWIKRILGTGAPPGP